MVTAHKYKAVLCDIEGTTTSISFVKDVLFPYCARNVGQFLRQNGNDDRVKHVVEMLIVDSEKLHIMDPNVKVIADAEDYEALAKNVRHFIQRDLKLTSLKELQGQMWTDGYKSGAYKSHVYEDTPRLFKRLLKARIPLFIYSSGSVLAQKLLFQHTEKGDLSKYIRDYFDTNFGPKIDSSSYAKIADHICFEPREILFLTDVDKEAYAARNAGFDVIILVRDGNALLSETCKAEFSTADTFDKLNL